DQTLQPWDAVVVLFVLTPESLASQPHIDYAKWVVEQDLPLIPVVEDIATYDFKSVPQALGVLRERNAVALKTSRGPSLVEAVRGYLGLAPFTYNKKVFISYNRLDGSGLAEAIRKFLRDEGYEVFIDVESMEGGVLVQDRIKREIFDKDLVLLIDSPKAASSEWVNAEITEAGARSIPICVVLTTEELNVKIIVGNLKRVSWNASDPNNLERVRLMVARGIASRDLLDRKIQRTLRRLVRRKNLKLSNLDRRRVILSSRA